MMLRKWILMFCIASMASDHRLELQRELTLKFYGKLREVLADRI